ncbi:uncharacterized protein [Amphiura filiformis]|uniref:uncharacterized protein isoform X2 n=1 Tax=Amphiura filiformis TaxID=82378 RepID=UPI003B20FCCF
MQFNVLKHLDGNPFANTRFMAYVELGSNQLEDLPVGFLRSSPTLEVLSLYNNRLTNISSDILMGLTALKILYLFQNHITEIPPLTFYHTSLTILAMFNNEISTIHKDALKTPKRTLDTVYMYYNDVTKIEDNALDWLANNSKVYLSASHLIELPHYPAHVKVFSVGDYAHFTPCKQENDRSC